MADVVITEFMDEASVADLAGDFDVLHDTTLVDDRDRLLAAVGEARGLIVRNRTRVDAALLAAAPRLVAVGRLGVGLDNIDLEACAARSVTVHPATGANAAAVAEYVIGAVLALVRGVCRATERVAAGEWPRTELAGGEIAGRRLGLVGFGGIARVVAEKAAALGMVVAAYDPFIPAGDPVWDTVVRHGSLDALLAEADAVSLHVPLVADTRNLIGGARLATMRRGAVLINTSRGGIVDEDAVVAALHGGRLGGAALDVFASEPVGAEAGARFVGVPNLILTPHIAGITEERSRTAG